MSSTANLDKILEQVRHLIAKADHPNTPQPEAEMCRTRAEALMFKYRIDEATANEQARESNEPVWRTFWIAPFFSGSKYTREYRILLNSCLRHFDCRGVATQRRNEEGNTWDVVEAVGYDGELRFAELLFTSASLAFSSRLEPHYDPTADPADMAFRLRASGMKRREISALMFGVPTDMNDMKAKNRRVTTLIKKGATNAGEDPDAMLGRGNNIDGYRESYISGFVSRLDERLRMMSMSRNEDGALVLASRKTKVVEALYERYPTLRPQPQQQVFEPRECERCKKAKSGYCREHRPISNRYSGPAFNSRAYQAGNAAADRVDLGKPSSGGQRIASTEGTTPRRQIG